MSTATNDARPKTRSRPAPPEKRREQLIQATIKCVAKKGLAGTTMADVTQAAGLSLGIVNLHFRSKDKLLVETLRYVADEYRAAWQKALAGAGSDPMRQLEAMVGVDFGARLAQRDKIAVWMAFWGEAKSRPTYQRMCADYDAEYDEVMIGLFKRVADDGGYDVDPRVAAQGLSALCSGLWLDILLTPKEMDRATALDICLRYLRSMFPDYSSLPG